MKQNKNNKIGTVTMNWFDNSFSYTWNPNNTLVKLVKENSLNLENLQKEFNEIFEPIKNFKEVIKLYGNEERKININKCICDYIINLTPSNKIESHIDVYI